MAILGDSAGLLFKIRADGSQAERELKQIRGTVGGLGGSFASLANPVALASAAIVGIGAAAVGAAVGLFNLAKTSSEYGSKIFDATEKTGLAAETISSLKFAADQSGSSLEAVTGGLARFAKTIGEAADGSEKAWDKLHKLGVTSKDLDTALGQALTTIAKYPPGIAQMTAAQAAFGRSGADLLPFIKSFSGDLPALIAKCKELGLTLSKEDAKAADEFGDTLNTLTSQAAAVGRVFIGPLMKDITSAMSDISGSLSRNQDAVKEWGEEVASVMRGLKTISQEIYEFSQTDEGAALSWLLFGHFKVAISAIKAAGGPRLPKPGTRDQIEGRIPTPSGVVNTEDEIKEQEKIRRLNIFRADNQGDFDRRAAAEAERLAAERVATARDLFEDETAYFTAERRKMVAELAKYAATHNIAIGQVAKFEEEMTLQVSEFKLAKLRAYIAALVPGTEAFKRAKQEERILEIDIETLKAENDVKETERRNKTTEAERKLHEQRVKNWKESIQFRIKMDELADAEAERRAVEEIKRKEQAEISGSAGASILGGLFNIEEMLKEVDAMQGVGNILSNTFNMVAQAVGNAVKAFVLFGTAGGSFRKFAAEVIASVAQMAVVQAVWELAQGFAMLALSWFTGNPKYAASAGAHFQAAAVYGIVGGVAMAAGRVVAGNAFQQQTAQATGQTSSSGQGGSRTAGAYSSQEEGVIDVGRNAPSGIGGTIVIRDKSGLFGQFFKMDWESNGPIRQQLVREFG